MKQASEQGSPWFLGKAQDKFLYLSDIIPAEKIDDPHNIDLELKVNGQVK